MSLTNAVRAALVLVDLGIIGAVLVGLVRFHRAGMARVRAAQQASMRRTLHARFAPPRAVSPDELVEAELARSWSYGPEAEAGPWWRP